MFNHQMPLKNFCLLFGCFQLCLESAFCDQSVHLPTRCEACVLFAKEFEQQLTLKGSSKVRAQVFHLATVFASCLMLIWCRYLKKAAKAKYLCSETSCGLIQAEDSGDISGNQIGALRYECRFFRIRRLL